jgi:hypothetical protein
LDPPGILCLTESSQDLADPYKVDKLGRLLPWPFYNKIIISTLTERGVILCAVIISLLIRIRINQDCLPLQKLQRQDQFIVIWTILKSLTSREVLGSLLNPFPDQSLPRKR